MGRLTTTTQRRWSWVLTIVVLTPFVVGMVHQWFDIGDDYVPLGDWSLLEMRVRDVGNQWLTTGAYSRFGWHHPGPALFYALAGPYRLLGSASVGVNIGGLLIGALAVVGAALIGWRRARLVGVVAVLVPVALLVRSFGADQLQNPWNAYVPILPFLVFLLLAWCVAVGDARLTVALVAVASFVIQCHLSYAVPSVPVMLLAVGACWRAVVTGRATVDRGGWWRVLAWSTAVAVVLWAPVIWGTFVSDDGNVDAILNFSGRRVAGIGYGLRTMALQWGLRPEWIIGARRGFLTVATQPIETQWLAAPWLLVPVVALFVARKRRDRDLCWIAVLCVVALFAGVVGTSRIVGPVVWYLTRWTWVVGALIGIVALLTIARLVTARPRAQLVGLIVATGVVVLASGVAVADAPNGETPAARDQAAVRQLAARIAKRIPDDVPVVLDLGNRRFAADYDLGLQLERRGLTVSVAPAFPRRFGAERIPPRSGTTSRLWFEGRFHHRRPPPGGVLLGEVPGSYAVYLVTPSGAATTSPAPVR